MSLSLKQVLSLAAGSVCLTGLGTLFYAAKVEPKSYRLETVRVITGNGSRRGNGCTPKEQSLRILHLSDLHLCHPEKEKVEFLRQVTDQDLDLVVVTGDIFENFTGTKYAREILARTPKMGAYAVLGNHDYYNYTMLNKTVGRLWRKYRHPSSKRDVSAMVKSLETGGFRVLRNEAESLEEHGVHIIGIDYPTISEEQLHELMGKSVADHFKLILFHIPYKLKRLSSVGAHLAVGGHTHGGQVRLPGIGAIFTDSELPTHQASGVFRKDETVFHISRGLGADPRSNIRLFCPPAATIIEVTHLG